MIPMSSSDSILFTAFPAFSALREAQAAIRAIVVFSYRPFPEGAKARFSSCGSAWTSLLAS